MSNIPTNSLSSLLQTFIKGAEEEGLVAIAVGKECLHPRKNWLRRHSVVSMSMTNIRSTHVLCNGVPCTVYL